jgi:hypothetical protein
MSFIRSDNAWYKIDDEITTELSESDAIQRLESDGVLLVYQREKGVRSETTSKSKPTINNKNVENKQKFPEVTTQETHNTKRNQSYTKTQKTRFFRSDRANNSYKKPRAIRKRRKQWKKIYIRKPENSFYDPDKNCYYIPRK